MKVSVGELLVLDELFVQVVSTQRELDIHNLVILTPVYLLFWVFVGLNFFYRLLLLFFFSAEREPKLLLFRAPFLLFYFLVLYIFNWFIDCRNLLGEVCLAS